jgi:hypothetical protein
MIRAALEGAIFNPNSMLPTVESLVGKKPDHQGGGRIHTLGIVAADVGRRAQPRRSRSRDLRELMSRRGHARPSRELAGCGRRHGRCDLPAYSRGEARGRLPMPVADPHGAAGATRSAVPADCPVPAGDVSRAGGRRLVYSGEPDGHAWEFLTASGAHANPPPPPHTRIAVSRAGSSKFSTRSVRWQTDIDPVPVDIAESSLSSRRPEQPPPCASAQVPLGRHRRHPFTTDPGSAVARNASSYCKGAVR